MKDNIVKKKNIVKRRYIWLKCHKILKVFKNKEIVMHKLFYRFLLNWKKKLEGKWNVLAISYMTFNEIRANSAIILKNFTSEKDLLRLHNHFYAKSKWINSL